MNHGAAQATGAEVVPGSGTATHYDSTGGGNCSYPGSPPDHLDVALSHAEYGTADACGGYIDVAGPNGTVRVKITNQCPECEVGHLDLSKTAFARVAPLETGQVAVSYSLVRNPPLQEPIAVRVKNGSSEWWMQIQAIDHGNPIATFELRSGNGWRSLVHTDDNFWMAENPGPGEGPFTVRITDIYGQTVTIDGIALTPEQVQRTDARLYDSGAVAPPPPPPTAPPTTTAPTTLTTTTLPPTTTTTTQAPHVPSAPPLARDASHDERAAATLGDGDGAEAATMVLAVGTLAALAAAALLLRRRATHRQEPTPDDGP
jgi:expansin